MIKASDGEQKPSPIFKPAVAYKGEFSRVSPQSHFFSLVNIFRSRATKERMQPVPKDSKAAMLVYHNERI